MRLVTFIFILLSVGCAKSTLTTSATTQPERKTATQPSPNYQTEEGSPAPVASGMNYLVPTKQSSAPDVRSAEYQDYLHQYQNKLNDYHEQKEARLGESLPQVVIGPLLTHPPKISRP